VSVCKLCNGTGKGRRLSYCGACKEPPPTFALSELGDVPPALDMSEELLEMANKIRAANAEGKSVRIMIGEDCVATVLPDGTWWKTT
jgi:hypothetical protein